MLGLMCLAAAVAGPLSDMETVWTDTAELTVGDEVRVAAGSFTEGPTTIGFSTGHFVELEAGDERVGFVFMGQGSLSTGFPDPRDARFLGNHLVIHEKAAVADVRGWAIDGEPLEMGLSTAVVLGAGPEVDALWDAASEAAPDKKVVGEAKKLWKQRRPLLDDVLDATAMVRVDLVRHAAGAAPGARDLLIADLETDFHHGLIDLPGVDKAQQRRLTLVRDPTARLVEAGTLTLRPLVDTVWRATAGPPLFTLPASDAVVTPHERTLAEVELTARLAKNKLTLDVEGHATLSLSARAEPVEDLVLWLPYAEAARDRFEVGEIRVTDEAGNARDVLIARDEDDNDEMAAYLRLVLAEPVAPGEAVTLHLSWTDAWPYQHLAGIGSSTTAGSLSLGEATGLMPTLPMVFPARVGDPWPFRATVGVPEDGPLVTSLSGTTTRTWTEDGMRWVEAERTDKEALWPSVALGNWETLETEARDGLPALRIHLFESEAHTLPTIPPEVARVITFYEQLLPPFPYDELDIFQAPDQWYGFVWIAPHAMVAMQQARVETGFRGLFTENTPHLSEGVLAHELAHQYWGHVVKPAAGADFWIAETFAETYSCLYVGAVLGPTDCEQRHAGYRQTWEKDIPVGHASLRRAYNTVNQPYVVYNYGPFVMDRMLRPRIGDQAFFGALDTFARDLDEGSGSSEDLLALFEEKSGQQLDDFWSFWVDQGFLPKLSLDYKVHSQGGTTTVEGQLTSGVPFGTVRVPVRIGPAGEAGEFVVVEVIDGVGTLSHTLPAGSPEPEVALDPLEQVLARSRKTRRVK